MSKVEGYVERITFRNEETGYTVLYLTGKDMDEGEDEICCVGCFSYVAEGIYLVVEGKEVLHRNYGPQIQVERYEEKQPNDALAMEKYLGSGAIKGVGKALAARIVRRFSDETFRVMEVEPERLAEVKGISAKMAVSIAEQFQEKQQMRHAMIFLQDYGISMNMAVKIYKHYGEKVYEVLKKNPYKLAEDVYGIGFKLADHIAQAGGFYQDSEYRIQAGILYCLQQSGLQGNCYLPEEELISYAQNLLMVDREKISHGLDAMTMNKEIVIKEEDGNKILYLGTLYYMELNCARMVLDLDIEFKVKENALEKRIAAIEESEDIELDALQKQAVFQAVGNGMTIITGGPGTGKTTTINTILKVFDKEGLDILLAAPTGRAAKRMTETTGWEAQTIHRLLEISGGIGTEEHGSMHFGRDEHTPLEADVVIVDEFSMVDIYLFYALLKAIVPGTRLIIVGDVNQLPSVGPGNVLKDLIGAGFCPVVRLNRIFRQAAESRIVTNAHKINAGQDILLDNKNMDFFHLERSQVQDIINVTVQLVVKNLPPYVDASCFDIQVLTPMRRGELGVENLNKILQGYINPHSADKKERDFHGVRFREHDKVMQIRNNYQIKWVKKNRYGDIYEEGMGIFNGDIGKILNINEVIETVEVLFDEEKIVEYGFGEMDELELAYAITIHKSQGSEYPAVVLPILSGPAMLMNRNLLYTAVTRAKKCVTIVGSNMMVHRMIKNVNERKRYSSLCRRIEEMME